MNDSTHPHHETTSVIVGGGPAGAVLSFMLARLGLPVTLLEMHKDFERDFRGDTLHPSTLEIMDELDSDKPIAVPGFVRWAVVSGLVARVMGFGILPEYVRELLQSAPSVL